MLRTAFLLLLVAVLIGACRKKETYTTGYGQGTGRCRIYRAANYSNTDTLHGSYIATYAYDGSNRISHIIYQQPADTLITDITYAPGSIVARHHSTNAGRAPYRDSLVLDGQGQVLSHASLNDYGGFSYWARMQYNTAGELMQTDYYRYPGAAAPYATETYQWKNGDLVAFNNGYKTFTYDYLGLPAQFYASDYLNTIPFLGRTLWQSRQLRKGSYRFDADGKIIRIGLPLGDSISTGYRRLEYECN